MIDKIARWITRHTKLVILIAVLLLIPSAIGAVMTKVNYDLLSYLPNDLDSVQGQEVLDKTFHNAASSVLVIDSMPDKDIAVLKEKVQNVKGVSNVIYLRDLLDMGIPESILPDAIKDVFYSKDGKSQLLMVQYEKGGSDKETMQSIADIRSVLNKQCFLSGISVVAKDTEDLVASQLPIYVGLAVLLALIAMTLTMESWVLPEVFMLGIGFAVVYNFGTNVFLGQVSYITNSIAAVLQLGVTMDYSIFLIDRYEEQKLVHADRRDAMASAISRTFVSLTGSSLTTIFGFLALCFMRLTLGRDIGLVMAKGVVFGVLTVVILLPALILAFDKPIHRWKHKSLIPSFNGLNKFLIKHNKFFMVIFLLLFIPAVFTQSKAPTYYNLVKALPDSLPSIVSLNKMKADFDMVTTHFVVVDDSLSDHDLAEMALKMQDVDGVATVLSLNRFVGPAIPSGFLPDEIKEICKKDGKQMIMINSKYESATTEENAQIAQLNSILKSYDKNGMMTGEGVLTSDLVTIADKDFKTTSLISVAAIFIIVALIFKSLTVPTVVVAAIELAIFINEGIPFFTGIAVPFIAPIVIGCVQLGATVDYAILLTTRFREEIQNGETRKNAILIAANAADRSILTSSLVFFCATVGVYLVCDIEIIRSICSMLARGAVISGVIIIGLLTPVLYTCEKVLSKTSIGWRYPKVKKNKHNSEK